MKCNRVFIDMDGTIAGITEWKGFIRNTLSLVTNFKWRPPVDVSWSVLTSRPRMDRWIIEWICVYHHLNPNEVITCDTLFYNFESLEEVALWKFEFLKREAMKPLVDKVIYIDDDTTLISNMPKMQGIYLCTTGSAIEVFKEIRGET